MHWDVGSHMVDLAGPGKVNPRVNDKIKNVVCPLFSIKSKTWSVPYFRY